MAALNHWRPHRLGPCRTPSAEVKQDTDRETQRERADVNLVFNWAKGNSLSADEDLWVTSEVTTWAPFDVWAVRDSIVAHLSKTTSKMLSKLRIYIPFVVFPEVSSSSGCSKTVSHGGTTLVTRSKSSNRATLGLRSSWLVERFTGGGLQQLKRWLLWCTQHHSPSFQFMSILEWNETNLPHKNNQSHTGDVKLCFQYPYLTWSSWFLMLMPLIFTV